MQHYQVIKIISIDKFNSYSTLFSLYNYIYSINLSILIVNSPFFFLYELSSLYYNIPIAKTQMLNILLHTHTHTNDSHHSLISCLLQLSHQFLLLICSKTLLSPTSALFPCSFIPQTNYYSTSNIITKVTGEFLVPDQSHFSYLPY